MADESAKAEARDALLTFMGGIAFGQVIERVAHGVTVDDEVERARSMEPYESRASAFRSDWVLPWLLRARGPAREPAGTTINQF
jgi:hypothetical protein